MPAGSLGLPNGILGGLSSPQNANKGPNSSAMGKLIKAMMKKKQQNQPTLPKIDYSGYTLTRLSDWS
jgi:hypothetical protein